jgi:hypothetical protein
VRFSENAHRWHEAIRLQSVPEYEDSDDEIANDETFVFLGLYKLDEA